MRTPDLPDKPDFGPTGEIVFKRTYARPTANGELESWLETVQRVARGNLELVYGPANSWPQTVADEYDELVRAMYRFDIIPGGRHLWATGVKGRQFLQNCFAAGWTSDLSRHSTFLFLRLMEGGGVGANYSSRFTGQYDAPLRGVRLKIIMDSSHPDYDEARKAGLLDETASHTYSPIWHRVEDSRQGWADALRRVIDAAWDTNPCRYEIDGGGVALIRFDLSQVRPAGAPLRSFGGTASGPVPLARMLTAVAAVLTEAHESDFLSPIDILDIDHEIAACVVAGGVRRAARMSIMRWDDPFIFDFIELKRRDVTKHWTTNISVEIDDEFVDAVTGRGGDPERVALAKRVFAKVITGMLENGEPGLWNSSLSNVGELRGVETTNPCGEIPLEPWEACNLGHVNLEHFADRPWEDIERAHRLMTRMLVRATFADTNDDAQREVMLRNRRIGVGHFGVQGYLVKRGIRYSEAPDNAEFRSMLAAAKAVVRDEARRYAFELRIPEPIKTTTIAPTGSIAKLPGATEGIHPVFARYFIRRVRFSLLRDSEIEQVRTFEQAGYHVEPDMYAANTMVVEIPTKERLVSEVEDRGMQPTIVEDASDLSLDALLRFQAMYQELYVDNAVSFTANLRPERYTDDDVAEIIARYLPRLKGVTLMIDESRPQAPYERIDRVRYLTEAARLGIETVDDSYDETCTSGACPVR